MRAVLKWAEAIKAWKQRVSRQREKYQGALKKWKENRELAHAEHQSLKSVGPRPKLSVVEKAPPRPKPADANLSSEGEDDDGEGGGESEDRESEGDGDGGEEEEEEGLQALQRGMKGMVVFDERRVVSSRRGGIVVRNFDA